MFVIVVSKIGYCQLLHTHPKMLRHRKRLEHKTVARQTTFEIGRTVCKSGDTKKKSFLFIFSTCTFCIPRNKPKLTDDKNSGVNLSSTIRRTDRGTKRRNPKKKERN